jgi:hypothetical protein
VLVVYPFSGLGDALLLGPVLAALAEVGAARPIGVLAPAAAWRTLRLLDLPLRRHPWTDRSFADARALAAGTRRRASRVARADDSALAAAIARVGYELVVELGGRDGLDLSGWLRAAGGATRLGFRDAEGRVPDGLHWAAPDARRSADTHWSRALSAPLAPLGVTGPAGFPRLALPASARAEAERRWGPGARLLLVPGASDPRRRWDVSGFAAAARAARALVGGPVSTVTVGAPSELELVRDVAGRLAGRRYAGRDLGRLAALVASADAVLSNDTGPMHLGFALDTPTVALFARMSPVVWGPLRPDPRHVCLRLPDGPGERLLPAIAFALAERLRAAPARPSAEAAGPDEAKAPP